MATAKKEKEQQRSFETHELVPYACHFDHKSLVTKNVELVQFIKLNISAGLSDDEFREFLRNVLNENIDPAKIAVWIHTVRTSKKITERGNEDFVKHIDILWKQALPEELRYANTIYISLVMDFKTYPLWQPKNFLRSLSNRAEENRFNSVINSRNEDLTNTADKLISQLKRFGAKRLEIVNKNGVYYSEPMQFLHKLLTFVDEPVPVPLGDISKTLYPEKINFNLYTGQATISSAKGNIFGAVITTKESTLLSANALKELLNTDYELVISEAIDFSFGNKFLPQYKYQKYVNSLTDDRKFVDIMGGKEEPQPQDFALHQVNILVTGKTQKELNKTLTDVSKKLEELGIIAYVEDVMLERAFWSMLAGNFSFLKRQNLVAREEIASFACFGVDKFTAVEDCMFGEPVTFFENNEGGAFALHFLNDGQSNMLIAGGIPEERQVVANLVSTQAAKFGIDIIFYDGTGKYQEFARSIGALYMDILDLETMKERITEKTLIVLNNIKPLVSEENLDFTFNFLDYAASKNAQIIACADYEDNCEALLPNFRTQIFLHGDVSKYADHFDFFEDEIRIVDLLEVDNFYFKHGYDELVLNFRPTERLVIALLEGDIK